MLCGFRSPVHLQDAVGDSTRPASRPLHAVRRGEGTSSGGADRGRARAISCPPSSLISYPIPIYYYTYYMYMRVFTVQQIVPLGTNQNLAVESARTRLELDLAFRGPESLTRDGVSQPFINRVTSLWLSAVLLC